ncbi:MAG TPA: hypothetical protein PKH07_07360, partial [bacterium]|nr:hypothetical protein [bacterium]
CSRLPSLIDWRMSGELKGRQHTSKQRLAVMERTCFIRFADGCQFDRRKPALDLILGYVYIIE